VTELNLHRLSSNHLLTVEEEDKQDDLQLPMLVETPREYENAPK